MEFDIGVLGSLADDIDSDSIYRVGRSGNKKWREVQISGAEFGHGTP
jgi:hypothetical protein